MAPVNVDLAFGTYRLYSVFGISTNPSAKLLGCTFGLGSIFMSQNKLNINTEISATSYVINDFSSWNTSQRYRISTHLTYNLSKHFAVFAGPSYSLFISDPNHLSLQNYIKDHLPIYNSKTLYNTLSLYNCLGFQAGLKYKF